MPDPPSVPRSKPSHPMRSVPSAVVRDSSGLRVRVSSYTELAKLRITSMVAFTTGAGFYLASEAFDPIRCLWTVLGTMLVASAACALNQVVEGDLDAKMRRTESRPIPTKRVSETEATAFALTMAIAGIALLLTFANPLTAVLAGGCLLFYIGIYTPLKTRTTWNTLVGAVAGAIPPLVGWASASGALSGGAWVLFGILFLWQVPHFFAIALLYRDDYAAAGYRMLPVVDAGGRRTAGQTLAFTLLLGAVALMPQRVGIAGTAYTAVAFVSSALFFAAAVRMVRTRGERPDARRVLLASVAYLPLILTAMILDKAST